MNRILITTDQLPPEPELYATPTSVFTIGERIRIRRLQLATDLTGELTAKDLGVTFVHYQGLERGDWIPNRKQLDKLANILGVSKVWIYHGHCRPGDPECWVDMSVLPIPLKLAIKGLLHLYRVPFPPFLSESDLPKPGGGV